MEPETFVPVLKADELPEHGFKAVELEGRSILIGRVHGQLFACLDRCPHAAAPLRIGKLQGEELKCQRHGWVFNVLTGSSVPDDPTFKLRLFPIKLEDGQVLIDPHVS